MEMTLNEFITIVAIPKTIKDSLAIGIDITLVSREGQRLVGKMRTAPFLGKPKIPMDLQGLYIIRDIVSGQFYVGSTSCMCKRKSFHMSRALKGLHFNSQLAKSFSENDSPNCFEFQYFVVTEDKDRKTTRELLYDFEKEILNTYHGSLACWNIGTDVRAAWRGVSPSEKTRALISQGLKGIPKSEQARLRMREAQKGKPMPANALKAAHQLKSRPIYIQGKAYKTVKEAASILNVPETSLVRRLKSKEPEWLDWNYVHEIWNVDV